jgi:acyl-CoA oxidase
VLEAARAHVDRIIMEAFSRGIEACDDDSLRPVLDKLFDLHALSTIERERGWFFEHGRMTAPRSKAITKAVNRLCAELRDHSEALVDAFAVPDEVIAAPIAIGGDPASVSG